MELIQSDKKTAWSRLKHLEDQELQTILHYKTYVLLTEFAYLKKNSGAFIIVLTHRVINVHQLY